MSMMKEITEASYEEGGKLKKRFSNDESRKAELESRKSESDEFCTFLDLESSCLSEKLDLQTSLEHSKFVLSIIKSEIEVQRAIILYLTNNGTD